MPNYISKGNGDWEEIVNPHIKPKEVKIEIEGKELDLNGDGKIDKKDASIASKVMNKMKQSKVSKPKKKVSKKKK